MWMCKNGDVVHMHITCSVNRNAYVHRCVLFLQSDVATYWPGMHNAALLVVFADLFEQGSFWQRCRLYAKLFKMQRKNTIFSISLLCKPWLSFVKKSCWWKLWLWINQTVHPKITYSPSCCFKPTFFFKISSFVDGTHWLP